AGGGGSGKSVALRHHQPEDEHAFTYDATLSSYQSARKLIDAALEHKQNVHVFYVHRPAGLAAHGMLKRAVESGQGRVVPGEVLAHAHYGAQQTIFQLQEHYREHPNVHISAINNSGSMEDVREMPLDELRQHAYPNREAVHQQIKEAIHGYHQAYQEKGKTLDPSVLRAALGQESGSGVPRHNGETYGRDPTDSRQPQAPLEHPFPLHSYKSLPLVLLRRGQALLKAYTNVRQHMRTVWQTPWKKVPVSEHGRHYEAGQGDLFAPHRLERDERQLPLLQVEVHQQQPKKKM